MAWEASSQAIFLGCPIPPYAQVLVLLRAAATKIQTRNSRYRKISLSREATIYAITVRGDLIMLNMCHPALS